MQKLITLNLLKEYGGIDNLIETVEGALYQHDKLETEELEVLLWVLKDYKKLKNQKKKTKKDDGWEDLPRIGDRHEMGG